MFSIIKKKENLENLVKLVNTDDEFLDFVKNDVENNSIEGCKYVLINDQKLDEIKKNKTLNGGIYLLKNNNKIILLEKIVNIQKGYLYNSKKTEIKKICKWSLISNHIEIKENIKNKKTVNNIVNQIKEFDFHSMSDISKILIIGKRAVGKSTIINYILSNYSQKFLRNSLIINPTEKCTKFYSTKYLSTEILYQYDTNKIKQYLNKGKGSIVLDDCLYKINLNKDKNFQELIVNGKNLNKLVLLSMQFPTAIAPQYRSNFNYVFLFHEESLSFQKNIFENYGSMFCSFEQFQEYFNKLTTNNCIMVIANNNKKNLNENIFYINLNLLK